MEEEMSEKEKRLLNLAISYYSRQDIQKAIFDFSKNRETIARHMDLFSKRPDSLEYPSDVIQLAKKGMTSFHCSEELWSNPLELSTGLNQEQVNNIRTGWDLLLDIDCKWIDYSKLAAKSIIKVLENHKIKNYGSKFSGGKGFHIIVPWKAFPKEINGIETKNLFPEIPRQIASYIRFEAEKILKEELPDDFYKQFSNVNIKKGIKCLACNEIVPELKVIKLKCERCRRDEQKRVTEDKIYRCPDCRKDMQVVDSRAFFECKKCLRTSLKNPDNFSSSIEVDLFELMGLDVVLVSPRHLFRAPYSLHEKGMVSVVLDRDELKNFELKDADPLRIKIKNFYPSAVEGEARELLINALDFNEKKKVKKEFKQNPDFKQIKLDRGKISHPPCISKILEGLGDGRKRAVFILINYFRSLGYEIEEIQKILDDWNKKNKPPLKEGYISSQISWAEKQGKMLPPNCDKEHYKAIGVCSPDYLCEKIKNTVNYTIRKSWKNR